MRNPRADDLIGAMLNKQIADIGTHFKSDALAIKAPIRFGLDDAVRHEIENLADSKGKRADKLTVIIQTTGGYIEVVERIYNVFRKHYKIVDFVVPNYAYSAGTVLVLSGDEIYMDYYSILGPIDPQYESESGKFMPGLGYLQKFNELVAKINKAKNADSVRAELAYLLRKFDPATLFFLEQAKSHSESLLEDWLPRHKFKSWTRRSTTRKKVTAAYKKSRARAIAKVLGEAERWHSHGRGIGIRELTSDEIKLQVVNFGEEAALNGKIRPYYDLFTDYCEKIGASGSGAVVLHTRNGLRRLG
jgi:hypothetical protein